MINQTPTPYREDAQADLMATLAASRELGPEMDRALIESYLEKHPTAIVAAPPPPTRVTRSAPLAVRPLLRGFGLLAGVVMLVAVLIASGGHAFWLLWLPIVMAGWWWRGWSSYSRWGYHEGRGASRTRRG